LLLLVFLALPVRFLLASYGVVLRGAFPASVGVVVDIIINAALLASKPIFPVVGRVDVGGIRVVPIIRCNAFRGVKPLILTGGSKSLPTLATVPIINRHT
jgi:hypothetical protein